MTYFTTTKKGFTLVELLVVIAIAGILLSIITVSLAGAQQKARDAKRIADIRNIQIALASYYNDNYQYPSALSLLAPGYISTIPKDPKNSGNYTYRYNAYAPGTLCNGSNLPTTYQIGALFEDNTNAALLDDADSALSSNGYKLCSGGTGDFNGTSADCSNTAGTPQGQAGATEGCYDVRPN